MDNAYKYLEEHLEEQNKDYEYDAAVSYDIMLNTVNSLYVYRTTAYAALVSEWFELWPFEWRSWVQIHSVDLV